MVFAKLPGSSVTVKFFMDDEVSEEILGFAQKRIVAASDAIQAALRQQVELVVKVSSLKFGRM